MKIFLRRDQSRIRDMLFTIVPQILLYNKKYNKFDVHT